MQPLIINCALSGAAPADKSPHIPASPEQLGEAAVQAWKEGASIVHIHARDDEGNPSGDVEHFRRAMEYIRGRDCDVLINLTTSFGGTNADTDPEVRFAPLELQPELASYDCGSTNFNERVFFNSPPFLRELAARMQKSNTKPEIEIFDAGMIETAKQLTADGLIDAPPYYQFVLGIRGGAPATPKHLLHLVECLPPEAVWSVCAVGRHQLPMDVMAIIMGGHARTGLEDNLYLERGRLGSNAELVARLRDLSKTMGREVATVAQAREILGMEPA